MRCICWGMFYGAVYALGVSMALDDPPGTSALSIEGKTSYVQPALVRLRAKGVADKAGVTWRIHPRKGVQRATTLPGILEFVAPAGTYEVDLLEITSVGGTTVVREASVTIEITGAGPPPPKPPPGKGPGVLDPAKATCRISFGSSGCTATVVGPRRADGKWDCLTASHCTGGIGAGGKIHLPGGTVAALEVTGRWEAPDITWMVADLGPGPIHYAELAAENPAIGTKVWHCGYGVDKPGNTERGEVTGAEASNGRLSFRLSVSSGDSGSGIMREDNGQLVGVVCCTTGRGRAVTMFGGSCTQAIRLRPPPRTVDGLLPVPIPVCPLGGHDH